MKLGKKAISLLLSGLMLAAALAGCSNGNGGSTGEPASTPSSGGAGSEAGGAPKTNADRENVAITFSQPNTSIDNVDQFQNDPILAAIQEATNLTINWDSGFDGYTDRLEAELIAGTGADLFPSYGELEKSSKWIKDGMVVNIGEIVSADPERYPILNEMISSPTWKMYNNYYAGDADASYCIYALYANKGWAGAPVYNKAIMDEVGVTETPETVDEFVDYCNKVAATGKAGWWPRNNKLANDAGLNEMDKTICAPNGTTMMPPVGNAWSGFMPVDRNNVEGEWKLMTTSEKTKEAVKTLAGMYKTNALDNGIGIRDDFAEAIDNFVTGQIGACNYGFTNYGQYDWVVTEKWLKGNPDGSYEDIALGTPLKGSEGRSVTYNAPYWMGYNWFIPISCENPDRVLDLLEYLASDAGQNLLFHGAGDADWTGDQWNEVNKIYGVEDGRLKYLWFSYLFAASQEQLSLEAGGDWYEISMSPIRVDRYPEGAQKDYAMGVLDSYGLESFGELPPYFTIISFTDEMNEARTKMKEITLQYIPAFIAGQKDIDAEWAKYVADYEAAGAAALEEAFNKGISEAKATYDSFQK